MDSPKYILMKKYNLNFGITPPFYSGLHYHLFGITPLFTRDYTTLCSGLHYLLQNWKPIKQLKSFNNSGLHHLMFFGITPPFDLYKSMKYSKLMFLLKDYKVIIKAKRPFFFGITLPFRDYTTPIFGITPP